MVRASDIAEIDRKIVEADMQDVHSVECCDGVGVGNACGRLEKDVHTGELVRLLH